MNVERGIWVFCGAGGRFPSGIFEDLGAAEHWISSHKLTGMLTSMPINEGVFDWALRNGALNLKLEKIEEKSKNAAFVGTFSTASLEHYHYENGLRA